MKSSRSTLQLVRLPRLGRRLSFLAAVLLTPLSAFAQTGFERGNSLYESGQFPDAAKAYEQSVQSGAVAPNLFFNLGNAYLRAGDQGRAVLNFQRALALQPDHPEAAANLAFVRRMLHLAAPAEDAWSEAFGWLAVDAWSVVAAAGAWLLVAGLVIRFGPGRRVGLGWSFGVFGFAVFGLGLTAFIGLRGGARNAARAIVVSPSGARAHYAPADNSRDVQTLAVGSEIRVLQDRGSWTYAELAGGLRGWVSSSALERIVPNAPAGSDG